jgi:hypothetical protein
MRVSAQGGVKMLVKLKKAQVNTKARGLVMPGRNAIVLPGDEAEVLAAKGDVEIVENSAVRVLRYVDSPTRGRLEVGSLAVELPIDEARAFAADGSVEILKGPEAEDAHRAGHQSTQTPAERKAHEAREREEDAARNRRDRIRNITLCNMDQKLKPLLEGVSPDEVRDAVVWAAGQLWPMERRGGGVRRGSRGSGGAP